MISVYLVAILLSALVVAYCKDRLAQRCTAVGYMLIGGPHDGLQDEFDFECCRYDRYDAVELFQVFTERNGKLHRYDADPVLRDRYIILRYQGVVDIAEILEQSRREGSR